MSHVVGVDLNTTKLEQLHSSFPHELSYLAGDVSQSSTSAAAVQMALQKGGRVDSLILNAANIHPMGPFAKLELKAWKKAFDVNFFALIDMVCSQHAHTLTRRRSILITTRLRFNMHGRT
jgi:NADP-dependent 3-hydroxy acid dehydrogenase YdfG